MGQGAAGLLDASECLPGVFESPDGRLPHALFPAHVTLLSVIGQVCSRSGLRAAGLLPSGKAHAKPDSLIVPGGSCLCLRTVQAEAVALQLRQFEWNRLALGTRNGLLHTLLGVFVKGSGASLHVRSLSSSWFHGIACGPNSDM